jgi:2-polyprenyl-3-methyl-5-hydroxy-6-metoxy-1,4-benzoquinol methylase
MQPASDNHKSSGLANAALWEKRSRLFMSSPRGVLFKSLPDIFNDHIHNWQVNKILSELSASSGKLNIIDVGCGYGRISRPVLDAFPEARITGIDVSPNYVELYRKNTGQNALIGFAEDFSLEQDSYDYILCVTVLMYVDKDKIENTLANLLKHLKKGGKILLIEPIRSGVHFQTCFGLLNLLNKFRKAQPSDTAGVAFEYNHLKSLIDKSGGKIIREYRLPATTLFFLPLYLLASVWATLGRAALNLISRCDEYLKFTKLPSLYTFNIVEKL